MKLSESDLKFLNRSIELGLEAEAENNMPFGTVIVLDEKIIAEGKNQVFYPKLNPGSHAEINALNEIDGSLLLSRAKDMVLYTNVEPCIMCFSTIILYKIGKVVFGGSDTNKGPTYLLDHLSKIYKKEQLPTFVGPVMQEACLPMWERANTLYSKYWDNTKPDM